MASKSRVHKGPPANVACPNWRVPHANGYLLGARGVAAAQGKGKKMIAHLCGWNDLGGWHLPRPADSLAINIDLVGGKNGRQQQ